MPKLAQEGKILKSKSGLNGVEKHPKWIIVQAILRVKFQYDIVR